MSTAFRFLTTDLIFNRKPDLEAGPLVDDTVHINFTAHFFYYSETYGQTQSASLAHRFRGEKWVEYSVEVGFRNSRTIIFHNEQNMMGFQSAGDIDCTAIFFQSMKRIIDKIEKNLLDLCLRSVNEEVTFHQNVYSLKFWYKLPYQ